MTTNPITDKCIELYDEGYNISAVTIMRGNPGKLRVSISRNNFVPLGDGGDSLPNHRVTIDRDKLPDGVTLRGYDRCEDYIMELSGNDEQAAASIIDVAKYGKAIDWAKFDGDTADYPHWLTKPNKWLKH